VTWASYEFPRILPEQFSRAPISIATGFKNPSGDLKPGRADPDAHCGFKVNIIYIMSVINNLLK
jgi:hypothetical protein